MIRDAMEIGVLVERRMLQNPWIDHAWVPNGVLVGVPTAAPWTVLGETAEATWFYAGPFRLEFFSTDTGSYRGNLDSGRPSLWISLRTAEMRLAGSTPVRINSVIVGTGSCRYGP